MSEPASRLQIAERQVGDVTVLALAGEITLDDGDIAFGKRVDDLVRHGKVKIVVNLSDVTYIDSAGVGMMVAEAKIVRDAHGAIKLASLSNRSERLLAILRLMTVFEVFEDEEAAIKSFSWGLRL